MATKKITELTQVNSLNDTDLLLVETADGTRAVQKSVILSADEKARIESTKSAYEHALENGFIGSEEEFYNKISSFGHFPTSINMLASSWTDNGDGSYTQVVTFDGGIADSTVELQPDNATLLQLIEDKVSILRIDNSNGEFTAIAIGACPTTDMTVQATIISLSEALPPIEVLPIERGGTGANTAEGARANLGLDDVSSFKSYSATIGTTWEEDSETGVKYQVVAVSALTGADDEKAFVDHTDSSIDGTSDGYALFVEEENQYLEFITNGRAETVAGGIRFEIFGDANTIAIPIEVRVS